MKSDRFAQLKDLLIRAKDMAEDARRAYLDEICKDDPELRREAESLLAHSDTPDEIMMTGAVVPEGELSPDDGARKITRPLPEGERVGGYRILRRLGEGGMGVVYEARQESPRRTVALKVVRRDSAAGDAALKRFEFEVQVLGRLNHPGIAQVYDAGTAEDGTPYVVMEYVPGLQPLEYAEKRHLDVRGRLELMAQVCDAIHYAHERGVIHRDLKPANILVVDPEGSSPQVKILDFGIARAAPSALQPSLLHTQTGQLIGTLAYMSPEQVKGRTDDLDGRSDVYQLGVILHELLTGRRPYEVDGLPVPEAARVIAEEEPPRLSTIDTRWRGDVDTIVGKALEKERERRYASAADLAEDIRRSLRGDPITARPPSAVQRLRLFRRRHRVLSQLAVIVASSLLLALALARLGDWLPGGATKKPTLAVLNFENLSPSDEDGYFAAGLTEDVITKFSQIDQLSVLSRAAIQRYRGRDVDPSEIRRDLGVDYFLEGSVRKEGSGLHVTAQLIDTESGFHVWARTFEASLDRIFAIQDTITTEVAEALGVAIDNEEMRLVAKRWTENAEAYTDYLTGRGKLFFDEEPSPDWSAAPRPWFEKALEHDPDYAPALAGLAMSLSAGWSLGIRRPGQLERAAELARRAKALDPTLWDAWAAEASIPLWSATNIAGREEALALCKELTRRAPEYGEGYFFLSRAQRQMERHGAEIQSITRAIELTDRTPMYVDLTRAYVTLGRFGEAETVIDSALPRHPEDPNVQLARGLLLFGRGRFAEAIDLLRSTAARHPGHFFVNMSLAECLYTAHRPAEADSVVVRILDRWPNTAQVWASVTRRLDDGYRMTPPHILGDPAAADQRLRRAIELEPYHHRAWGDLRAVAQLRDDAEEEERILKECMERWPDDWRFSVDLAGLYERRGDPARAEETFRTTARRWPNVHWTLGRLAEFYLRQERDDEAKDVLREYERRWPDDATVRFQLSYRYDSLGRHDLSEAWARRTLELRPNSRPAHTRIGWECFHQGKYDEAIGWFEKAIAIGPPDIIDYRLLSRAYWREGSKEGPIRTMEDFVELRPISAGGWLTLGFYYEWAGEIFQAAAAYERALELEPDRSSTVNNLAEVYGKLGRTEKEFEMYERAVELDTTNTMPLVNLAMKAFSLQHDTVRADSTARRALARTSDPYVAGSCLSLLGSICSARGEPQTARDYFEKALAKLEEALRRNPNDLSVLMRTARTCAAAGDRERAGALVERAVKIPNRRFTDLYNAGCVMAVLGEPDSAFHYLRLAVDAGWSNRDLMRAEPDLASLHDDPRFEELAASVR